LGIATARVAVKPQVECAPRTSRCPIAQFRWTQGEDLIKRFDLPEAKSFARQICGNCNCPIPHASRDGQRVIVPSGTLDDVPPGKPAAHGHWSSRVSWVEINESDLPCTD